MVMGNPGVGDGSVQWFPYEWAANGDASARGVPHLERAALVALRNLRLLKGQQKVSGCFHSDPGADAFARLRSYLSTPRKEGVALLGMLPMLFTDTPLYPAF